MSVAWLCATIFTWMVLVTDNMSRMRPVAFGRALRGAIEVYGATRVVLWLVLCLVAWWLVWIAWMAARLRPR